MPARRRPALPVAFLVGRYGGTFGPSIGFAAGLPLQIQNDFETQADRATTKTWTGPFIGARVTMPSFGGVASALVVVFPALPSGGDQGSFWAFFTGSLVAFAFSGPGNGSAFRQLPVIFREQHVRQAERQGPQAQAAALKQPEREAGAVTGSCATCLAVCWCRCARKGAEAAS
ncbi:hypothetical protein ACFY7H_18880 [Streptomyces sp. NPDC012794]|uniref:hypothetical protein n=1 Tax=Streptomyces sp. NPDC012794 TaxID=3364850 RepID=UPI00368EF7FC